MRKEKDYRIIVMDGDKEVMDIRASSFIIAAESGRGVAVNMRGTLRDLMALAKCVDLALINDQIKIELVEEMVSHILRD